MRTPALFSLVLLMFALTASGEQTDEPSFEMLSGHYDIVIIVEAEPLPSGQIAYEARVKDRVTGTVVAQPHATAPPETVVELSAENGGVTFTIDVHPHPQSLQAEFEARRDGGIVDKASTVWDFSPDGKHLVAPAALHVGGDVKAPIVIKRVEPLYSEAARKDTIVGIVILEVLIDKSGNVADAMVLKDLPDGLGDSATAAVKQWKFRPATKNGEPVDVLFNLTINFKLR